MSDAVLEKVGEGQFKLSGDMIFKTANALLKTSCAQFEDQKNLTIDMAGVRSTDTAGLALMIEWVRHTLGTGKQIRFTSVPAQLLALAEISDVQELLPIG